MGKPVKSVPGEGNEVFLTFDVHEHRFAGFGGCNPFFGQFEPEAESGVRFSNIGSTRKFCAQTMELENEFFKLIESVDNYTLDEGTLSLNGAERAQLLRF